VDDALEALKAELERFGADNATSHAEQMAPFVAMVEVDTVFSTCLVPAGKGEFLAVKTRGVVE
jgi:hypothetical protein